MRQMRTAPPGALPAPDFVWTARREPLSALSMIWHDEAQHCFRADGGAVLEYSIQGDRFVFDHTEVPPALRGQGIAAQLAHFAFNHARQHNWRVVPACSFIDAFLRRNPQFADLVDPA